MGEISFTIRKANACDFPDVMSVWEESVRASHGFLKEGDILEIRRDLLRMLPGYPGLHLAVEGDRVLGFLGLSPEREGSPVGRVDMLFVDPACQGRGVGTGLLAYAKGRFSGLALEVNEGNPLARSFYERRGFVLVDRLERDLQGRPFPLLRLSWPGRGARGTGARS